MPDPVRCACGWTFTGGRSVDPYERCPNCGRELQRQERSAPPAQPSGSSDEFAPYKSDGQVTDGPSNVKQTAIGCASIPLLVVGWCLTIIGLPALFTGVLMFVLTSDFSMVTTTAPITAIGLFLVRAGRRHRKRLSGRSDESMDSARPTVGEWTSEEIEARFDDALALEQRGEWQQAVTRYEELAAQLRGQPNAEYALNCANRLRDRMNADTP